MSARTSFDLATTPLGEGFCLIDASAGTGKTFTIAGLFLRLILERDVPVREILVVTFTEAATEELRGRIRKTLADAAVALAAGRTDDKALAGVLEAHWQNATALASMRQKPSPSGVVARSKEVRALMRNPEVDVRARE